MKDFTNFVTEKYEEYQKEFEANIKEASSVSEMLHVYACYTGKLEALLDGVVIGGK